MGRLPGLKTDQCVFLWLESVSPADSPFLFRAAKTPWNIYRSGFICLKFRQMRFSPAISLRHTRPPRIEPTFARYPAVSRQDPAFDRLGQRQTAVAAGEKAARSRRSRATNAELGRFAPSYAHLPCRLLTAQHPCDAHAGAGGARSWAINDRMSANICLDTATSAIWKVT